MCYSSVPLFVGRFFCCGEMNVLDLILAAPMVWLTVRGWRKGLVREVATLVGVLAGIWAAVHLSQAVSGLLGLEGESAVIIAFFITFVGALVLAYLLGRGIERLMKAAKAGLLNHIAGAALGLTKALCILAVLLGNIVALDRGERIVTHETKERSVLYKPVYDTGNRLTASLKEYIDAHKEEWRKEVAR